MSDHTPMTMKDIARELGISVATVSRALKDSPHISRARREQIQQFAREHNYYPNAIAEQLRHSRKAPPRVIGVIIPEFVHYYFASILSGIEEESSNRGYRIIVAQSLEKYEREVKICEAFYQNKVCGIIVSQAKDTVKYDHFKRLIDSNVPLVFYDRICPALNASRVVVDDYQGAFKAVSHLIDTGCQRVAYYGTTRNMEIGKNRFNGYKDALYQHGMQVDEKLVRYCDSREVAEVITPDIMRRENHPDGFFAVNDETAVGIISAVKKMGLRVPEDVAVCGFSNSNVSTASEPQITTVEQRGVELGKQAADILINIVEGKIPFDHTEKRIVKTRLVVRGSTKPQK